MNIKALRQQANQHKERLGIKRPISVLIANIEHCGSCSMIGGVIIIEVRKGMSDSGALFTLAHEMKHAQQYADGLLDEDAMIFRGKYFGHLPYDQWPHEAEANAYARSSQCSR